VTDPPLTLERRMERLDAIVAKLESEGLELDDALALFEEGVSHIREVERMLHDADLRIERLIAGPGGTVETEPVSRDPG
jgi:exodeoxyribonuclease VII small subunit